MTFPYRPRTAFLLAALLVCAFPFAVAQPTLENGFRSLYNLDFPGAQNEFASFQRAHPSDPMGPASEAAGLVFAELDRLGLLDSQVFISNETFRDLGPQRPDPKLYARFLNASARAEQLANPRLAADPKDRDALMALTLISGLRADYAALVQDRKSAALQYTKQGTAYAERLLAFCSDCNDAYVATGIAEYLIGVRAAPVRWFLHLNGFATNKKRGMDHLRIAADRGHLLAPFAKLLLALAYLREKDPADARVLLASLHSEFPGNPLFAREVQRLEVARGGTP